MYSTVQYSTVYKSTVVTSMWYYQESSTIIVLLLYCILVHVLYCKGMPFLPFCIGEL